MCVHVPWCKKCSSADSSIRITFQLWLSNIDLVISVLLDQSLNSSVDTTADSVYPRYMYVVK